MTVTPEDVLEQVKRVAEKCADRAHRIAGTHYASPHLGRPRRVPRTSRHAPKVLRPLEAQPGQGEVGRTAVRTARRMRHKPGRAALRMAKRSPYLATGISAFKAFVILTLLLAFLVPTFYWWVVEPWKYRVESFGQAITPDFDDEFGQDDLPEWHQRIIPGSLNACPGLQPVAATPPPLGGAKGAAAGWGRTLHRVSNAEVTAQGVTALMRTTFVTLGGMWGTFQQELEGMQPAPTVAMQPSSLPGAMSTKPLSDVEVAELARAVGWPEAEIPMVVARVKAESGGDPRARDYVDGSHQGLLQMGRAEQRQYLPGEDPFDPRANLRGARKLWEARGWQPWRASDASAGKHLEAGQRAAALGGVAPAPDLAVVDCGSIQLAALGDDATPLNAAEAELSTNAIRARRAILAAFPGTTIGGWGERGGRNTEHDDRDHTGRKASRAIDVMTYEDMQKGERVAQWVRANWDELRVQYIIWDRRIWTQPDNSRPYTGPSPHTDHPHLTLRPDEIVANA